MTGAKFHNEHPTEAFEDTSIHYWHVQTITIVELDATIARGLRPGVGLELLAPLRLIRSRIRYEDMNRQPYTLVYPDYHHRNETPVRLADPTVSLHFAKAITPWTIAGRMGISVPIGRTEQNPFALGRLGLPHEHFQFGTGTWDPVLSLAAGRELGGSSISATGLAHLVFYRNEHGYQAGNRYNLNVTASRSMFESLGGMVAVDLTREEAEHWDGRLEEEGNLGRTDVLLSLGLDRPIGKLGAVFVTIGLPIYSKVRGEQGEQPPVFTLGWSPIVHGEHAVEAHP